MTLAFTPPEYLELMTVFENVDLAIEKAKQGLSLAMSAYELDKQTTGGTVVTAK